MQKIIPHSSPQAGHYLSTQIIPIILLFRLAFAIGNTPNFHNEDAKVSILMSDGEKINSK